MEKLRDSVTGRAYYKPESSRFGKKMRKTLFAKRQPRRDRNVRTPFREKTKEHGTERITGAELWKRTHGERMSESSIGGSSSSCSKKFFMPGDAFAQLHNLSSHMAFAAASKTLGGTPDTLETEADWDTSNDGRQPQASSCKPNIQNFVGLVLGPARGLTDTGAQQLVVGASAAQWWCGRLRKRYGLVPVDVTPSNMIATCGGIGAAKVLRVLNCPAGIFGVNGVMRFLVLEEPVSPDGKQQFIPPLKTISLMRQLCANIRMRERESEKAVTCWSSRTTVERSTLESWLERERDTYTTTWILSRRMDGTCHTIAVFC